MYKGLNFNLTSVKEKYFQVIQQEELLMLVDIIPPYINLGIDKIISMSKAVRAM
jgi:hypothetical protein